ncbi:glutathione S-transferase family protein [Qipengyuania flava]|uniref:glutathione S-transferase family protein n=1 Tax=Qipengyuania flava TaxID=192812 RepID=UPI001C63A3E7|nr:glutathione S-transferase family protein [Qipengyuania flava]QYJ06280.1 glutathione S-transferase family protein [Qipengyuania flava]
MTAEAVIHGTVVSTYTRIVQIVCEEAGLLHRTVATPAHAPGNRHPFGKVPVVDLDGLELFESVSVVQYIDNAHNAGGLQPADPARRAVMDRWIAIGNNYLFPLFERGLVMPWVMHRVSGFPLDRKTIDDALPSVSRALAFCEAELQQSGGWDTSQFDLADVFLYPILRSVELTPQGEAGIGQCPALAEWLEALHQRPSIVATRWPGERET